MHFIKWLNLQLFGGEGAGGSGGSAGAAGGAGDGAAAAGESSGVEAADPGRQRLLELGVPETKLRKNRSYTQRQQAAPMQDAPASQENAQQDDAAGGNSPEGDKATGRMTFAEIMADPEYNKEMQAIVQARLKGAKSAEESLKALTPALELLARQHGMDYSKGIDYAALAQAVNNDDQYYEDMALELGVDIATARKVDQDERETKRAQRQEQDALMQKTFDDHMASLESQGQKLKAMFPNFDLHTELKDPRFARMVAPNGGVSVEDAFYAIHRKEIQAQSMQVAAQRTAMQMSDAIASGSRRPAENGASRQAPSQTAFDYRSLSPEQRKAFKDRLRREGSIPLGTKF